MSNPNLSFAQKNFRNKYKNSKKRSIFKKYNYKIKIEKQNNYQKKF